MPRNPRAAATAAAFMIWAGGAAAATESTGYLAWAEVVSVSPRYRWEDVAEPVRYCETLRTEPLGPSRYYPEHRSRPTPGAGLLGGLIGGLIGNQFGGGHGRTALTVAGAALGASVARDRTRYRPYDEIGYRSVDDTRVVRRCTESNRSRLVRSMDGYDVTYRYHGRTFHKWVADEPGDKVVIEVAVEPLP